MKWWIIIGNSYSELLIKRILGEILLLFKFFIKQDSAFVLLDDDNEKKFRLVVNWRVSAEIKSELTLNAENAL